MRRSNRFLTALAVVGFMAAGSAAQASVTNLFILDGETLNIGLDDSAEYISTGGTGLNQVKGNLSNNNTDIVTLEDGDILRGMFTITQVRDTVVGDPNVAPMQWTGVFSTVVTLTDLGASGYQASFSPDDDFGGWLSNLHTTHGQDDSVADFAMDSNTMIRMFENDSVVYDQTGVDLDPDANIATATAGTFFWDMGFGDFGNLWETRPFLSADVDPTLSFLEFIANANFELSLLQNNTDAVLVTHESQVQGSNNQVHFSGSIQIRGGAEAYEGGFHAADKATFYFAAVPTPAAVLPGLIMFGIMGMMRPRRRPEDVEELATA